MKKIFKIDAALYPLGLLTAVTGFGFHIAGHGSSHHVWVLWAYAHTLIALIFVVMIVEHLCTPKGWVKGLKNQAARQKRSVKITCFLALLALAVILTGIVLLAIAGANTHVGLLHYKLGIAFAVFAIGHSARRFHILRKAIRR